MNTQAATLYDEVWQADAEPTSSQMQAISATQRDTVDALKRWKEFQDVELPALNRLLREASVPEIHIDKAFRQEETQIDEE